MDLNDQDGRCPRETKKIDTPKYTAARVKKVRLVLHSEA